MKFLNIVSLWLAVSLLALPQSAAAEPQKSPTKPARPSASSFTFRVETPDLQLQDAGDGYAELGLAGFEARVRHVGAPEVPLRIYRVAIPEGAEPRLEVFATGEQFLAGVTPRPVPLRPLRSDRTEGAGVTDVALRAGVGPARDAGLYEGEVTFPASAVWLGEVGVLRAQRYVEVHVAPYRYDPTRGGVRGYETLEVTVHFEGATARAGRPRPDARFESVYRGAFENYAQGLTLRLDGAHAGAERPIPPGKPARPRGAGEDPRYKLRVSETGVVRLDFTTMGPTGLLAHPVANWKLVNRGVAVPLHFHDGNTDGMMGPGEWVQFYGQALEDEPKAALNTDFSGNSPDLYEARDFSDVNVYFLTVEGSAQPLMTEVDASPAVPARTPETHFRALVHMEVDSVYRPLGGADPWYWDPTLNAYGGTTSRTDSVALTGLYSGTEPVTIRSRLRGLTNFFQYDWIDIDQTHHSRVSLLDGSSTVLASDDGMFEGRSVHTHEFEYDGSGSPVTSTVKVRLELLQTPGPEEPDQAEGYLDWFDLEYSRDFVAAGDVLVIDWPDGDAEFIVEDLQDDSPEIYEVTVGAGEPVIEAVRLVNGLVAGASAPYTVRFRVDNDPGIADGETRRFVVVGDGAVGLPGASDFESDTVSDLRDPATQADMIVIAHADVLDAGPDNCTGVAPTGCLTALLDYHATPAGGGLSSKIALLEDVQDEFYDGLSGPLAIREFLRWVLSDEAGEGWADPKPAYVMLLGDGSFNYKAGTSQGDYVPTQIMFIDLLELGYYASDNLLAAVVGPDSIPDYHLGRVPVRSTTEANSVLRKIVDYSRSPDLTGNWQRNVLFIADRGAFPSVASEGEDFETTNALAEEQIAVPPYNSINLRYWSDYCDGNSSNPICDKVGMNEDIVGSVNGTPAYDGVAVVQFIGHGSFFVWSNDAFFDESAEDPMDRDTAQLGNGLRLPWLLAHNCLTGGFHIPNENTMGEDWFELDGAGAIGAFSPSGLSFNYFGQVVAETIFADLYGPAKIRDVATPVMKTALALCGQNSIEACQYYINLGDPALRLLLPTVAKPEVAQATGGDAQATVSWTHADASSVVFDVYRRESLQAGAYELAGTVSDSPFVDTGLVNVQDYYYYVVARDPEGFLSSWSNFNSDCAVSMDCDPIGAVCDCLVATPLNPNPPSTPTGLEVEDPGNGSQLELSWQTNPELDLASYTVHWGTTAGTYTDSASAGLQTRISVPDLTEDVEYFFVLTATNTSGLTSAPSGEKSGVPVTGLGLRAPAFIDDLRVAAQGDDLLLEWTEVTTDVFGKPKTVASYRILRGVPPGYENSGLTELDVCASPCASYLDGGARTAPVPYFYRVQAVDAETTAGGLGSELPGSTVLSSAWSQTIPGDVELTWVPVTTTLAGGVLDLSHYAVYMSGLPFTREAIRDGAITPAFTTTATSAEVTPPAPEQFYVVLPVDIRGNLAPY